MKFISVIILFIFGNMVLANNVYVSSITKNAENMFKENLNFSEQILFTYVPRGLIISIDEAVFFNENEEKIKQASLDTLNQIGYILNRIPQKFVIEGHTESNNPDLSRFTKNWELSLARANNIAKYLIRYAKVKPEKIFTVGFGEYMPFFDNVSNKANLNNRIDFVILEYEASR